jgi:hypothetical protein
MLLTMTVIGGIYRGNDVVVLYDIERMKHHAMYEYMNVINKPI